MAPTIPQRYRELTVAAVLLGVVQGIILNVAFAYTALKLGFSMGASPIAALLGYVFLRGILRKGTIVENNINQTIAAGIASAGTGVVFVLPAIFLLNAQEQSTLSFSFWPLLLASIGGAILGVVLLIPLRKQLIEIERLRFPSGVAVAAIIRAGAEGIEKAKLLGIGFLISAVWTLCMLLGWFDHPGLIENTELNLSFGLLPAYLAPALYLSPMNFAAGLLAGRAGLSFLWGGILAWWIISPISVFAGWTPHLEGQALADFVYDHMLRPLGIGIILGSAFMEVFINFPAIKSAILSLMAASRSGSATLGKGSDEAPLSVLLVTGGIAIICFFLAAWITPGVSLLQALLVAVLGSIWLALAGLIVAQTTGLTDISPVSGLALISVSIMMVLFSGHIVAALLFTITVAVAISHSADMMQDLKTGFLVGSRPLLQQIVQIGIGWIGVVFTFGIIYLLWDGGTAGSHGFGPGTPLPAPQAATLTSIVEAVKNHSVPIDKFVLGSFVGLLLGAAPVAGLGVLTGLAMYLPLSITLGYGMGCLMEMAITTRKGLTFTENKVVPLAAGLIIGEAIVSVVHAIYQIWHSG